MKFQLDQPEGVNNITRMEPGRVWVGPEAHERAVLVPWQGAAQAWAPATFEQLSREHFAPMLALRPELVILGTGPRHRFAHPALYRDLIEAGIGLEAMELHAACRTFNVLAGEGRKVLAALLFG
ncbi:Mth938-like domain-containing protein [Inhella gelatinilytica]|uniref:Mth938-like domain-containing protein n=1 Tax=Inhella gelatinilytica TaxID=2795030 RepID=A0A931IYG5_9BURK|nr:Mth938-like domain-containing protein [Inhella gelatinilytica]MBH9554202.1 Mth938-like domain-containing protein [Inhella gelatinilytica]